MPQPAPDAAAGEADGVVLLLTANTDSFFSSSAPAHEGQVGVRSARVRYSNSWPQARQAYSKSGITVFCLSPCAQRRGRVFLLRGTAVPFQRLRRAAQPVGL